MARQRYVLGAYFDAYRNEVPERRRRCVPGR
jgi:hypothetical protein